MAKIEETIVKPSDTVGKKLVVIGRDRLRPNNDNVSEKYRIVRARRILKDMVKKGLVERLGRGRNTYYV